MKWKVNKDKEKVVDTQVSEKKIAVLDESTEK
jgi:hypothetical protein